MRKASIIAMAALALLTAQCKKNEPKPEEKVMVPITGSVDFGGSKTEITTSGYITPVSGDVIYIYDNGSKVGSMTCTAQTGQQFTCSGTIQQTSIGNECTFMYLGSSNGTNGDSESISFADQTEVMVNDGKIANLNKFHVGSCKATVSETGTVTLPMATKMSIAYFQLTDGTNPIADKDVTISGVYATANIDKREGTLIGVAGNITVHTDLQGKFYMALVPQSNSVTFSFAVDGKIGSNVFPYGIRECSFYSEQGSGNPLQVTVTQPQYLPGEFTVDGSGNKVKFSKGNLQYIGSTGTWRFAEHQWDYLGNTTSQGSATENVDRDLFGWGCTGNQDTRSNAHTYQTNYMPYSTSGNSAVLGEPAYYINPYGYGPDYYSATKYGLSVNDKSDWGCLEIGTDPAGTWRTLSNAEWKWLLGPSYSQNPGTDCRTSSTINGTANARYAMVKVNDVCGLMVFPDVFAWPSDVANMPSTFNTNSSTWNDVNYSATDFGKLESAGVVFLPAAGYRKVNQLKRLGTYGIYWSSSCYDKSSSYCTKFEESSVDTQSNFGYRAHAYSVRLVR